MPFFRKRTYRNADGKRKDMPGGLWLKCPSCSEILYKRELDDNLGVCRHCGHHFQLTRDQRIRCLAEPDSFVEFDTGITSVDVLGFTGTDSYPDKLAGNIRKTGHKDAVSCGEARIGDHEVALGVMDFSFLGASMGSVVGEKVTRLFEHGLERRHPVVLCCASGGARMYEGMFSLMQMAKTSAAIARLNAAAVPYIPVLTHPTMAGVMASFATLGDAILAEPGALIGFAGPRVIKETTQQELPEGFQRAEFLEKKGLIDLVVPRSELRATLARLLDFLCPSPAAPEPV